HELKAIMTDPAHQMHEGWMRNDPKVHAHLDAMYKRAYPSSQAGVGNPSRAESPPHTEAPLVPPEGLSVNGGVSDRYEKARTDALANLRKDFGPQFVPDMDEDPSEVRATLQQDWGPEFQARWAGAHTLGTQLAQHDPQVFLEVAALVGDARGM